MVLPLQQISIAHSSENGLNIYFINIPKSLLYICGTYGNLEEFNDEDPDLPDENTVIQIENILQILKVKYDNYVDNLYITEVPSQTEIETYIP